MKRSFTASGVGQGQGQVRVRSGSGQGQVRWVRSPILLGGSGSGSGSGSGQVGQVGQVFLFCHFGPKEFLIWHTIVRAGTAHPFQYCNSVPFWFRALGDITRQLCDGSGGGTVFFLGMAGCGGCGYCASVAARHHNQVNFHQNQSILVQNMVKTRYSHIMQY